MILAGYISKLFVARFAICLAALASLLQILDLLDNAGEALERGGGAVLLKYAALRLPSIVDQVIPISVLLAALITLLALVQSNEIVAMRSFGITVYKIVASLAAASLAIAILHFLLSDQIAPRTERAFRDWWSAGETVPESRRERFWLRDGSTVVAVDRVMDGGRELDGLSLFQRDDSGKLTAHLVAERAMFHDGEWRLFTARRTELTEAGIRTTVAPILTWPTHLTPANFADVAKPTESLSLRRLLDLLTGRWAGPRSKAFYETRLHRKLAFPAASIVMVLLAAPVAHGLRRRGGQATGLVLGLAIGFCYLFVDGMMLALGQAGVLPSSLAVWSPLLFFASVGGAVLIHLEG